MRAKGLAAILLAVIAFHDCVAQTAARAAAQAAAQTVCAGSTMPAAWVWTASQTQPQCGPRDNNAWVLNTLPADGQITVCGGQAIPAGWVKTGTAAGTACKLPSASPLPPQSHGAWVLTALSALAGGSMATVCAGQALPVDWLRIGTQTVPGQCMSPGESGASASHNQWAVVDSAGKTDLTVCAGQVLPSGWHVVGFSTSATNCRATGAAPQDTAAANNLMHIRKDRSTCQLRVDTSTVAPGAPYRLSLSSLQVPAGASVIWTGTKNGTPDLADVRSGTAIDTYLGHNGPGQQGTYTRQVEIRSAQGQMLCSTNPVAFTLAPVAVGRP